MKKKKNAGVKFVTKIKYKGRQAQSFPAGVISLGYYSILSFFLSLTVIGIWRMLMGPLKIMDNLGQTVLIAGLSVLGVVVLLQARLEWYFKAVLLGSAAGILGWLFRVEITTGLHELLIRVRMMADAYYNADKKVTEWQGELPLAFKAAVLIFLALWVCFFYCRVKKVIMAAWLGILVFFFVLLVGVICGLAETVCFLLGCVGLMAMRKHRRMKGEMKLILKTLVPVAVVVSAAIAFQMVPASPERTPDQEERLAMRGQLEDFFKQISRKFNGSKGNESTYTSGGLSGGNLSQAGNLNYQGKKLLSVTVDEKPADKIYLHGYSGDLYSKGSWLYNGGGRFTEWYLNEYISDREQIVEEDITAGTYTTITDSDAANVMNLPYFAMEQYPQTPMQIVMLDDIGAYQVLPYTARGTSGEIMNNDSFLMREADAYQYTYMKDFYALIDDTETLRSMLGDHPYAEEELAYRKYIYDVGLKIPAGMQTLKAAYPVTDNERTLDELIPYIRDELASMATYSLNPGKVPEGKDPIEYFLFENKKGYCMHFASAGTLLFRLNGVPARYVEGYVLRPAEFKETEDGSFTATAQDYQSHAWVEIYLNGLGWIPVEVTPGFQGDMSEAIEHLGETAQAEPTETSAEIPKPEPELPETGKKSEPDANEWPLPIKMMTAALIFLLIYVGGLLGRYYYNRRKQQKILGDPDWNKRVCWIAERIRIYVALDGLDEDNFAVREEFIQAVKQQYQAADNGAFKQLLELTDKAAFSQDKLTEDEYIQAYRFYQKLINEIFEKRSRYGRFVIKYIKCL